jgi:hypothetical protein
MLTEWSPHTWQLFWRETTNNICKSANGVCAWGHKISTPSLQGCIVSTICLLMNGIRTLLKKNLVEFFGNTISGELRCFNCERLENNKSRTMFCRIDTECIWKGTSDKLNMICHYIKMEIFSFASRHIMVCAPHQRFSLRRYRITP